MKKLIFTLLVCSTIIPFASAQKAKIGFTMGGTVGSIRFKSENGKTSITSSLVGFSIGAVADLPMGKNFIFQPALQFLQKGGAQPIGEDLGTLNIRLNDLELPLNFLYKTPSQNGNFVFGLGPTFAYSVGGNYSALENGQTSTEKIKYGSNPDQMKPFEFGADVVAGYEWNSGFYFQALYNLGFTSHWNNDPNYPNDPEYMKTSYIGLRIGFLFGGK